MDEGERGQMRKKRARGRRRGKREGGRKGRKRSGKGERKSESRGGWGDGLRSDPSRAHSMLGNKGTVQEGTAQNMGVQGGTFTKTLVPILNQSSEDRVTWPQKQGHGGEGSQTCTKAISLGNAPICGHL